MLRRIKVKRGAIPREGYKIPKRARIRLTTTAISIKINTTTITFRKPLSNLVPKSNSSSIMLIISYNVRILVKYYTGKGQNSQKTEERAKYPYNGTYQAFNSGKAVGVIFPGLTIC